MKNEILNGLFRLIRFPLLAVFLLAGCTNNPRRPNIVVIMADDLGYSDLGAYGSEIQTPNLDQMAREGVAFTQFYNIAKCTQSRASLLTGLYHQQTDNLVRSDNNVTLPELLGEAGYETIMAGKWHLGKWKDEQNMPTERGFDHYFGFLGGAINYFTGEDWGTGKNYMRKGMEPYEVPDDFYSTDAFTDYALEQIDRSNQNDNPFFLYLAYNAPHFPLQVPRREIDKYTGVYEFGWDRIREMRYERMQDVGLIDPDWALTERDTLVPPWNSLTPEQKNEEKLLMATYAGMVDRMDQQIGLVMKRLDELGVDDNTIMIFLSDNGGCPFDFNRTPDKDPGPAESARSYNVEWANVSSTPFRKYKQWIHEGGIATPMLIRWPEKIEAGTVERSPGHVVDIMPTLLEMARVSYPKEYKDRSLLPLEGESLIQVLQSQGTWDRKPMFWEFNGSHAVRDGRWKLVAERGGPWELYNMKEDRSETENLVGKHSECVARMAEQYDAWAQRVGARTHEEASSMSLNHRSAYTFGAK